MTWQLVEEVLDHAPGELTPAEALMLVAVAEWSGEDKRLGARECERSTTDLARRARIKVASVRAVLNSLARRGLDIRVPMGTDKKGKPVYCHRGRVPRYRLPAFPTPDGCGCDRCHRSLEGATTGAPSALEGAIGIAPSGLEGGPVVAPSPQEGATTIAEGAILIAEGATVIAEGATTVAPFPSSVLPTVREGGRTEEETAPRQAEPAAVETELAAPCDDRWPEALTLVAGLPWPGGQRPNRAKAEELAGLVHAAVVEHGQTLDELDVHLRGRLLRATRNASSYLARALAPDELPISAPPAPTLVTAPSTPTRSRAIVNESSPRAPETMLAPATVETRSAAQDLFRTAQSKATSSARLRAQHETREQLTPEQEQQRRRDLLATLQAACPEISAEVIPSAS